MARIEPGMLVYTGDSYGLGRLRSIQAAIATVEIVHSIAHREMRAYPLNVLRRCVLEAQTRVFVRRGQRWRIGRIAASDQVNGLAYEVRFPNGQSAVVPESDVDTRCHLGTVDPTDVLAAAGFESGFLHDRRRVALEAIVGARAASRGLTGLQSAAIELVPHQMEVARRILEDPIQRYLLADEVGLGKTVEAGIVIRQCLLDDPSARIAVFAPRPLVRQWQRELRDKFALRDFLGPDWGAENSEPAEPEVLDTGPVVVVCPFSEMPEHAERGWDLLVVDEAHHVVSDLDGKMAATFPVLQELAQTSRRLLLLSATPILGNEAAMLGLLHLLDPLSHPLDDPDRFAQKVARRQALGRLQLALSPTAPGFRLRSLAAQLPLELPGDEAIVELAAGLQSAASGSLTERADAVRAVKQHLTETYRLHHRLLRTRRRNIEGWELLPRQGEIRIEDDDDERVQPAVEALETWRDSAQVAAQQASRHDEAADSTPALSEQTLAQRYGRLVEALGRGTEELALEVERQWLSVERGDLPTFGEETEVIEQLREAMSGPVGGEPRHELAAGAIQSIIRNARTDESGVPKLVAFSSSHRIAKKVRALLLNPRLNLTFDVFGVLKGMSEDEIDREVERFRSASRPAVMICDATGEEGLNFQFAQTMLHLDLPLAPARLEQRIGRIDRFGRASSSIHHRIFLPVKDEDSPWMAWLSLLRHGFGLFETSISEVQFVLRPLATRIELLLFRRGAAGLIDDPALPGLSEERGVAQALDAETRADYWQQAPSIGPKTVRAAIEGERRRLDEQYALDQLTQGDDSAANLFSTFDEVDRHEAAFGKAIDGALLELIRLDRSWGGELDRVRFRWSRETLLAERRWRSHFEAGLNRPSSYRRALARRTPDTALLRPGSPLVDALELLLRADDRGTVFATWRRDARWPTATRDEWLGFRLCFVVSADIEGVGAALGAGPEGNALPVLRRRAEAYLPPSMETLYVDESLAEVTDPLLLEIVGRPYQKLAPSGMTGYDVNLGSRQDALFAIRNPATVAELCRRAREHAEDLIRNSPAFQSRMQAAATRARDELTLRSDRLRRRHAALLREGAQADPSLDAEQAVNAAILEAVITPSIRLDSIGLFVISDAAPVMPAEDDD